MNNDPFLRKTFEDLLAALHQTDIPFHVVGGFAVVAHGEYRLTNDLDILIPPLSKNQISELVELLEPNFVVAKDSVEDAVMRRRMFNVIGKETVYKVDFHIGEGIEGELERSEYKEIIPGISMPVASRRDLILSKLIWIKKGSNKSRQDVYFMLRRSSQDELMDVEQMSERLGLKDILESVKRQEF